MLHVAPPTDASQASPLVVPATSTKRLPTIAFVTSEQATRADDPELEAQAATLQAVCATRGWQLCATVHEVGRVKGKCRARPPVDHVLALLSRGEASCVMVTSLGRLCRSVAELGAILEHVIEAGGRLVSLEPRLDTGTPAGRAAAEVLLGVGGWEREQRAARSRVGLARARAEGMGLPGIDPALKQRIKRMRNAGMTLQAIVDDLNEAGIPTARGGARWRPSSVQAAVGYRRPTRA